MHPAFLYWWKYGARHGECGTFAGHGAESAFRHWEGRYAGSSDHESAFGGGRGVRRPLRFLAYRLDLTDAQVSEMARILNELKTERAQAEVDGRRTVSGFADALEAESFDETKASDSAALRVESAERLRQAVVRALKQIHAVLSPEQRARLAYLIRTGALVL